MIKINMCYTWLVALFLFTGCASVEIPAILENHPDKASFTLLNNSSNKMQNLFNRRDLSGFYTYTEKYGRNNDIEQAFRVGDGVLHFDGPSMGYLCTEKSYKNYYLRVEFRWGETKFPPRENARRDSGILYHFAADQPDKLWPKSVECQVQEEDCGDYFLIDIGTAKTDYQMQGTRIVRSDNFENPGQEWNVIEIIAVDNHSEHYVNGHKVNAASDLSVNEGRILLQLEAAEVYYKSIQLLQLK